VNVIVALDHRFLYTPDGKLWTQAMFAYPFWTRYLSVFEGVTIVGRAKPVPEAPAGWLRADGDRVGVVVVPYYIGPWQFLARALRVWRVVQGAVRENDAVILRVESHVVNCMERRLRQTGHPYGVEVTGDPYDQFAPGSVRHVLRAFMRWWYPQQLKRQCAHACAAAYVTEQALQRRYPCPSYSVGVSDVELPREAYIAMPRTMRDDGASVSLVYVGTMEQLYKAPDVLIEAVAQCVHSGLDLRLTLIGDGKHRQELERLAADRGLGDRVRFMGQLTAGAPIRAQLDAADLFVLPSHQEGLPRATVEAMARGLPCIGSVVGGFPELLASEDLVPPGNIDALAEKILTVARDRKRMERMSARNLARARSFADEALQAPREAFYRRVRVETAAWLVSNPGSNRITTRQVET